MSLKFINFVLVFGFVFWINKQQVNAAAGDSTSRTLLNGDWLKYKVKMML